MNTAELIKEIEEDLSEVAYCDDEEHHELLKNKVLPFLTAAEADAAALRAAIRMYGAHLAKCSSEPWAPGYLNRPCDCGLRDVVERLEALHPVALATPSAAAERDVPHELDGPRLRCKRCLMTWPCPAAVLGTPPAAEEPKP